MKATRNAYSTRVCPSSRAVRAISAKEKLLKLSHIFSSPPFVMSCRLGVWRIGGRDHAGTVSHRSLGVSDHPERDRRFSATVPLREEPLVPPRRRWGMKRLGLSDALSLSSPDPWKEKKG